MDQPILEEPEEEEEEEEVGEEEEEEEKEKMRDLHIKLGGTESKNHDSVYCGTMVEVFVKEGRVGNLYSTPISMHYVRILSDLTM